MRGSELIELCKEHVVETMGRLGECQPGAEGLGNKDIEPEAEFGLGLARQDGWLTWSLLMALIQDETVEAIQGNRGRRYRLVS